MNRIKELRNKKRLSQTELAEKTGISQPLISRCEKGFENSKASTWQALANFFGVSIEYLQGKCTYQDLNDVEKDICREVENIISVVLERDSNLTAESRRNIVGAVINDIESKKYLV